jgi:tetratricopeptide (TPR) repeat protein
MAQTPVEDAMTTESEQPAPDPSDAREFPESEVMLPATADDARTGVMGRWVIAAAVALLLVYPLTRWMMGGSTPVPDSQATPASSSPAATTLLNQSLAHGQARRFKECFDTATEATKLDFTLAAAFNNRGFCAGTLGLWDEAILSLQEAVRLDPGFQLAKNNLTWAQQEKAKAAVTAAK